VVFDGGARSLLTEIARLQSLQSRNDYRIAVNAIITEVSAAYFDALKNRDAIAIHKNTLDRARMQFEFISKEVALGDATRLDALAIEAQVREVELNLCRAEENYSRSLNRLKLLLRIDWRQAVQIIGDIYKDFLCYPIDGKFSPERLIAIGVKNRKEVASADVEFSIQRQKHLLNTRYYYPKVSFGLNYSLSGDDRIPHERGWGVSMQVSSMLFGNSASTTAGYSSDRNGNSHAFSESGSLGILDSLAYRRTIAESEIAMKSSFDRKTRIRQQVAIEINSALKSLDEAWKMIALSRQRLDLYDSFLAIERLKADMGESRRYDLVKKEIERGEAALARLSAITAYMLAAAAVETAAGLDIGSLKLVHARKKNDEE
jgi:outer membrane protein TolC